MLTTNSSVTCRRLKYIRQYAYIPPENQQSKSLPIQALLPHEQMKSARRTVGPAPLGRAHISMHHRTNGRENQLPIEPTHFSGQGAIQSRIQKAGNRTQMLPPPTPQVPLTPRVNLQNSNFRPSTGQPIATGAMLESRRFVPSTPVKNGSTHSMYTASTPRRFMPQQAFQQSSSASTSDNRHSSVSGLATNSRTNLSATIPASMSVGQRMSFLGNSSNSFG